MKTHLERLLRNRISTSHFDKERHLDEPAIRKLIDLASTAPSAFNLQNWRFIAVQTPEAKDRLHPLAYGQDQVRDAAVTFIVCGRLDAHEELRDTLQPSVDRGLLPASVQQVWVDMAQSCYAGNGQARRDEAIRSASLAAMTLMLAAEDMGLTTGAIGGFDPDGVAREFNLSSTDIPVMLLAVGYALGNGRPQKIRKPVEAVLEFC